MSAFREKLYKARSETNGVQRYLARRYLFPLAEKLGFHILGDHFYEPIPNLESIRKNYSEEPRPIPHHTFDLEAFESEVIRRIRTYGHEIVQALERTGFDPKNYYFRGIDALSYYCLLRDKKPHSVVEVGQGMSTRVAVAALERNATETGMKPQLLSIDPYARLMFTELRVEGVELKTLQKPIQEVPTEELISFLGNDAVFFTDSSHVYKHGSDVWYLMHQVYPYLPVGTVLHIHDIVLPYPWLKSFYLDQKWFWNEQEMLESFLSFNDSFAIKLPVYWLHKNSEKLHEHVRSCVPDWPLQQEGYSFYLQRVK